MTPDRVHGRGLLIALAIALAMILIYLGILWRGAI